MVEKLQAERRALELARADAEREASIARDKQRDLDRERERLAGKERGAITREGGELLAAIKAARDDLRSAQARLRSTRLTEEDVRVAARAIDAVAHKASIGGELEPRAVDVAPRAALGAGDLRVGLRVWVPKLRANAEIVEILGNGQLRVAAGSLKLTTHVNEVRLGAGDAPSSASTPNANRRGRKHEHAFDAAADDEVPIATAENTVDLRGLRAHEAASMAEQFLDRSLGAGRKVAFLVHGHGTGALRDAVREQLRGSRYVARMRPGEHGEGGDGATVVWLRW
jgi:DNA mismatch repair protein MutS2